MSSVLARKRTLSDREFYTNAIAIRTEVLSIVSSDKVIPKSKRFLLAIPTADDAKSLVDNITIAEEFYPNTAHNVVWRKHYYTLAVGDCYRLIQDLQTTKELIPSCNLNRFKNLVDMLEREIALIRGQRKATKLIGKASIEERIALKEVEIKELQELQ